MSLNLATRFFNRFRGLMRAHGEYIVPADLKPNAKGKLESPQKLRKTVVAEVTPDLWLRHLSGDTAIGIVPINDDAVVYWAAADIDVYDIDLQALDKSVQSLGLPLILCRTKSGGAHLYVFFTGPVSAELARKKLQEWVVRLGHPKVEIFPKQVLLANDTDYGNWLNMPYQASKKTTRYALRDGKGLTAEEFLDYADEMAISAADFAAIKLPARSPLLEKMLDGAPPCLVIIAETGETTYRNNVMFSYAIYLKKRFAEDWVQRAHAFNDKFMKPPLATREIDDICRSVSRKNYSYKCKDQPICDVCNREVCLTREFGVGSGANDPGVAFGQLQKLDTEPPIWIWSVDAANIELTTEQLMNQKLFQLRVVEVLNKMPILVKANTWHEILEAALSTVQTIEVPEDATREGQLLVHLHRYCTSRVVGASFDELLLGKPYTDKEAGRTYFVATDFLQYLQQHRVTGVDEKRLFAWLREHDAKHHKRTIKGKSIVFWSVPMFTEQADEFTVPRKPVEEAM